MAAEGRELGWEDSIKQDAQDYEPIPEGDYNVTIEKFDRSRSKGEGKLPPCTSALPYREKSQHHFSRNRFSQCRLFLQSFQKALPGDTWGISERKVG